MTRRRPPPARPRLHVDELEARLLYSADAALLLDPTLGSQVEIRVLPAAPALPAAAAAQAVATPDEAAQRRELVAIDASVADPYALLDALAQRRGGGASYDLVVLDADRSAQAQLGELLQQEPGLTALHLIGLADVAADALADALQVDAPAGELLRWQAGPQGELVRLAEAAPAPATTPSEAAALQPLRSELVFIDERVADIAPLLDELVADRSDDVVFEVIRIDASRDGLAQISAALAGRSGIDALHLLSHGAGGELLLGSGTIDSATLQARAAEVEAWRTALSADADLLLYGCEVAADDAGRAFVEALAGLTGADVAASVDATGAAAMGGNWALEHRVGRLESDGLGSTVLLADWQGLLAVSASGAASVTDSTNTANLTWSHTVASGSNRVLIVTLAIDNVGSGVSSVTYGGVALTQVGRTHGIHAVEIWRLVAPTVGTANVVVTLTGNTAVAGGAQTFVGVDPTQPTRTYGSASGTGTTASVVVGSAAGDLVVDAQYWDGNPSGSVEGANQTIQWWRTNAEMIGGSTTEAGAASVTMSGSFSSSTQWEIGAVSLRAAPNVAPVITSNGGGASASVSVAETRTAVTTVTSTDADGGTPVYSIAGGLDAAKFTIHASTGALAFITAPDFEAPTDSNADNVYNVTVQVSDGAGGSDTQAIAVTVTDVSSALLVNTASDNNDSGITAGNAAHTAEWLNAQPGADGKVSLREAILAANNTAGLDTISFSIGAGGVQTIALSTQLPEITDAVVIDGSTQSGYAGTPLIVLDGSSAPIAANGLSISAGGSTVRGLGIQNFGHYGIYLTSGGGNLIEGNHIGINAAGSTAAGNGFGIVVSGSAGNTIGGTTTAARNLISGNSQIGIRITGAAATGNTVAGNYVGLNAEGTAAVANGEIGINIEAGASNNTIGGATAASRNVVSGNVQYGVCISDAATSHNTVQNNYLGTNAAGNAAISNGGFGLVIDFGAAHTSVLDNVISGNTSASWSAFRGGIYLSGNSSTIQGNIIGLDATGTTALGNGGGASSAGIYEVGTSTGALIGGTSAGQGNLIAGNTGAGVIVKATGNVQVLGNSIYGNSGLGIDLGNDGVTANDAAPDADSGANGLQNFPVLWSANSQGGATAIVGQLDSEAGRTYRIEFFANAAGSEDASGYGEGATFLGAVEVSTDGSGRAAIDAFLSGVSLVAGSRVSATATEKTGASSWGSSSEFAMNVVSTADAMTPQVALQVAAVNDAPSLSTSTMLPGIAEDAGSHAGFLVSLLASGATDADSGALQGIAVTGVDDSHGTWQYTLDGSTWADIGPVSDSSARLLPSDATARIRFVPDPDWNGGTGHFKYRAWDQTDGVAGALADTSANGGSTAYSSGESGTMQSVMAVNDAPVNQLPGTQLTAVNAPLVLSTANGNAIQVADVDAAAAPMRIELSVTYGSLTLARTTGLSFSVGDGTADAAMTFTGTLADVNAALDGATFTPTAGYRGSALLTLTSNDQGASGSGGALGDSDTLTIAVGGARYQEGVDGYSGTQDTWVGSSSSTTNRGSEATVVADDDSTTDAALLRFEQLFGSAPGQIPWGATIDTATLSFYVTKRNLADSVALHRMLVPWTESSTYQSLGSGVGGGEIGPALLTFDSGLSGWNHLTGTGLTAAVQAWANGDSNHGWAFISNNADAWAFASSENGTVALRPYLTVSYSLPQAPVVTLSGGTANYVENAAPVAVDSGVVVSDADSTQLTGAVVRIGTGYASGQDQLVFTNQNGITGLWDSGSGTLTLSGTASLAHYQAAALRSVAYANSSDAPNTSARTIEFSVTDAVSGLTSALASRSLTVQAVNDAPTTSAVVLAAHAEDGGARRISQAELLASAQDVEGDPLTATNLTIGVGNGTLVANGDGSWSYTPAADDDSSVSFSYTIEDGGGGSVAGSATLDLTPVNDAAVISGSSAASLTESDAVLTTGGSLSATDVDSAPTFVAQTNAVGSGGYGKFSIGTDGAWSYTANTAHNEFEAGQTYTDTITVATADGTEQVLSVTITGTNDAAVISGSSAASLTESDAVLTASGSLSATDVDSAATFVAQTNVAGSAGYGKFSIDASGAWTYTMDSAHNEFEAVQTYTDTITVATADGTEQVLSVTITGTNDAAVISGSSAASLTESDAVLTTGGSLSATDVDSAPTFVAQTNAVGSGGYGKFSIGTDGAWSYTANTAHDEFEAGQTYTDTITVATADGTEQVLSVTITGTNDAAVITGDSSKALTESDAVLTTGGSLSATDVDSAPTFVAQTNVAGSGGYGQFSIDANGAWTYTMDSAHNEFVAGQTYTDTITVATADGTEQVLSVTITGTNDAPTAPAVVVELSEDQDRVLSTADFGFTDVDAGDEPRAVRVEGLPTVGHLRFDGVPVSVGQEIAAAQLGQLVYSPPADAFGYGLAAMDVRLADAAGMWAADASRLAFDVRALNDAPELVHAQLALVGGRSLVLTSANLLATDVDSSAAELRYTVSAAHNGRFESIGRPDVALDSFTQAEVNAGRIRLVATSASELPSFSLLLSDGVTMLGTPVNVQAQHLSDARPVEPEQSSTQATGRGEAAVPAAATPKAGAPTMPGGMKLMGATRDGDGDAAQALQAAVLQALQSSGADEGAAARGTARPAPVSTPTSPPERTQSAAGVAADAADAQRAARLEDLLAAGWELDLALDAQDRLVEVLSLGDSRRTGREGGEAASLLEEEGEMQELSLQSDAAQAAGAVLTAGSVWWALRAGGLVTSLLSSLPTWRHVDLLAVLPDDEEAEAWDRDADEEAERDEAAFDRLLTGAPEQPLENSPR